MVSKERFKRKGSSFGLDCEKSIVVLQKGVPPILRAVDTSVDEAGRRRAKKVSSDKKKYFRTVTTDDRSKSRFMNLIGLHGLL